MSDLLAHPLVVLLAGAVLTGLIVPAITRRWQARQKELEIKAELVSELSEAIMQIVMAVQFARARADIARSQAVQMTDSKRQEKHQQEFDDAYRTWEVRSAVLGTKLEAYFAGTTIPADWIRFSEVITRFYALEGIGEQQHQQQMSALRDQLLPLLPRDQQLDEGWSGIREGILAKKSDIIRHVLTSRISAFRSSILAR